MSTTATALDRSDRFAVGTISWLAAVAALSTLVGLVVSIFSTLGATEVAVSGVLASASAHLGELSGGDVDAYASTAEITVRHAPASVRGPLLASVVATALTPLSITTGVFLAGRQIARQHFRRTLAIITAALAVLTFASGLFAPFFRAIASSAALRLGPLGNDAPFAFQLDGAVLATPTLLLIVSALLFVSERLQKEAEGLV